MKYYTIHKLISRMAARVILFLAPIVASASNLYLAPSSPTVMEGDLFQLDLFASGVGLGAYDVTFSYNPLLVSIDPNLITFDTHLGGPDNSFPFVFADLDTLELAEVSFLTNAVDLAALQTDPSYPLAHIQVRALLAGTVSFEFVATPYTIASDYAGNSLAGVAYQGASVTIVSPTADPPPASAVPEPDTTFLVLMGVGLLAITRFNPAVRKSRHPASYTQDLEWSGRPKRS